MPQINLQVSVDLDADQLSRVASIFGVANDPQPTLERLAAAALEEYVGAFSGARSPQTIVEFRENRLNLLFKHLDPPQPTDRQIEQLFQRRPAAARGLVQGVRARFETEISTRLDTAIANALKSARAGDDDKVIVVFSDSVARYAKDVVGGTRAPQIEARRDASQTYDVIRDTVEVLCDHVGIAKTDVTALDWS